MERGERIDQLCWAIFSNDTGTERLTKTRSSTRKATKILPFSKIPKKSSLAISFLYMSSLQNWVQENPRKSD